MRRMFLIWLAVFALLLSACGRRQPLEQVWRVNIDGQLRRPPLVNGDLLLVAPRNGFVLALNRKTGGEQWRFAPEAGIWHESLSAGDGMVFVAGQDGVLYALNQDNGSVRWQHPLDADAPFPMLLTADGTLYLTTTTVDATLEEIQAGGATLWAFDASTGEVRWQFRTPDYIFQTPVEEGGRVYVGGTFYREVEIDEGGWMHLYALEAANGRQVWRIEAQDGFIKAIYATPERVAYIAYRDFVVGLDAATGTEVWRRDTGNWVPSLTGKGDTLWFGSANTKVHAWDVRTGDVLWETNLKGGSFNYLMHLPVPMNDRLYLITQRGDVVALKQDDGRVLWRFSTGGSVQTGIALASDGLLYVGDEAGYLTAYRIMQ